MSKCKGCGAEILWVKTQTGKNMPIDAEPASEIGPMDEHFVVVLPAQSFMAMKGSTIRLHRSHWGTCPKREEFKR